MCETMGCLGLYTPEGCVLPSRGPGKPVSLSWEQVPGDSSHSQSQQVLIIHDPGGAAVPAPALTPAPSISLGLCPIHPLAPLHSAESYTYFVLFFCIYHLYLGI